MKRLICLLFGFSLPAGLALAEEPVSDRPLPPPLSKECQTPGMIETSSIPLPNVTRALKQKKSIRLLTIGASEIGGRRTARGGYLELIDRTLKRTIKGLDLVLISRGISGELAANTSQRLKTEVAFNEPDLVLWQVGTTDALARVPIEEIKETLSETLQWLKAHNVDAVLVGLHYSHRLVQDPYYQAVRRTIQEVADSEKVMRINRYEAAELIRRAQTNEERNQSDEFDETEEGYTCMAEYAARAITSGIFARPLPPASAR